MDRPDVVWLGEAACHDVALVGGKAAQFSRLADRFGGRWPVVAGLAIFRVGVLPLALGGSGIALPTLVVALAVAGVGLGLSSAGLQTSAVEAVPPEQAGSASGVYSNSRYFGSIVGASVLAAVL